MSQNNQVTRFKTSECEYFENVSKDVNAIYVSKGALLDSATTSARVETLNSTPEDPRSGAA